MPPRPGLEKRRKEASRQEHQKEKAAKKQQRKADKERRRDATDAGVDPDIAGIVPGPQPAETAE